jgi:putative transposase
VEFLTRQYEEVLPAMAETAGVSRSSISRQAIEGSAEQLRQLRERRWDKTDLLVIYIDGQRFGDHQVISGVGIDREGSKHILSIEVGATENAAAVKNLLTGLRDRGLCTEQQYLFVIDGAKALRAGIEEVFGSDQPVQRCRNHIAGRDPRLPEGWKVPSRASPCEPGSPGSGMAG